MPILKLYSKKIKPARTIAGMAFIFCLQVQAQGLYVGSSTNFISNGAINIIFNNVGLTNAGSLINNGNTITFTGTAAAAVSAITGPNIIFNNLVLNKSAGDVQLNTSIAVNGNLSFTGGNLQLNNYNVDLGSGAGTLVGESETGRIIGTQGGSVLKTAVLTGPYATNPGNIGIYITSPANLGSTLIKRGHIAQTVALGKTGIYRYFEFTPTNNTGLDVSLQFNYFDAELNGLPESGLYFWSSNDAGNTWAFLGKDGNTSTLNLVLMNAINQLGRVTLASSNTSIKVAKSLTEPTTPAKEFVISKIYPNPAKDFVNIVFTSTKEIECSLALYAQTGQVLEVKKLHAAKGPNFIYWAIRQYAAGAYYFKFINIPMASSQIIKVN